MTNKTNKAIDIAGTYIKAALKIDEKVGHSSKVIKVLINSLYLLILAHLITKLL